MSEKSTLSFRSSVTVTLEITRSYRPTVRPGKRAPKSIMLISSA